MTFREIAALIRRHLLVTTGVLLLAIGVAYEIKSTQPKYAASAIAVFTVTKRMLSSPVYASFAQPLIATETMMVEDMLSPPARDQVFGAGGNARFTLVPFNFYNLQYPDYSEPFATVTITSSSPAAVRRTFSAVHRVLAERLAGIQAGVPARGRIRLVLVGDSGPVTEPGSAARTYGGLALLSVVAVFMVSRFLDRRGGGRRMLDALAAWWAALGGAAAS